MRPALTAAANFVPSDDDVMLIQTLCPLDVLSVQVTPELLDVKMCPTLTAAANFVPSDDDVMLIQSLCPLDVLSVQVSP